MINLQFHNERDIIMPVLHEELLPMGLPDMPEDFTLGEHLRAIKRIFSEPVRIIHSSFIHQLNGHLEFFNF